MSFIVLEKNGVDNQNVDGGAFNNFAAGGRDGIVGGVLAECALTAAGSAIGISPGLIILHGIRIKVTGIETLALSSVPLNPTSYQIVAQVTLASNGDVDFSFFIRTPQPLVQNALYQNGEGTYQAELASFTHNPDGTISNLTKTLDIIYGSGGGDVNIEVGTVTTETLAAGLDADFDVSVRREEGTNKILLDFDAKIPRGASGVDEGAVHFNEEQTLTDQQRQQARENIDAASTNGNFPDFHAGYAEKDEQGNPFPPTYAKATIVPVRWNGGYWSSYGGQSAKAGDLALIIDNTGSTGYQKGCLYKVSSASGSSMSLSPTKIADWVSARAIGEEDGENLWGLISALDEKINKTKFYVSPTPEDPAEIYGGDWEQIVGRLIIGAGSSYPVLSTGGNLNVTLQYSNIPQHNHGVNIAKDSGIVNGHMQLSSTGNTYYFSDSSGDFLGVTTPAGDSTPFSIMPPYFSLYVWYRLP